MSSLFIVLDGPDATGTTTHAKLLVERLTKEGHAVLLTSEPSEGPVGKNIREYLKSGAIDPMTLQLLFTEDRLWHVEHVIQPALKEGKIVVCDRYWHSTIVYSEAQGLDVIELKEMNQKFIQPDYVLFTLPPIEISLKRLLKRAEKEFFEKEVFQRKIHDGYHRMAQENPAIQIIDTSGEKSLTAAQIYTLVSDLL